VSNSPLMDDVKPPPQYRACTRTDRFSLATYIIAGVVVLISSLDPSWPRWQAVAMAFLLGGGVGTSLRDAWWRKELRRHG
jgi:lipoprotein signal peptidase